VGSACAAEAARLPNRPIGTPRAQHVGLAATARLGGRRQSVVVESSMSCMVSHRASTPSHRERWEGQTGHEIPFARANHSVEK
jgi:hypothetical protein